MLPRPLSDRTSRGLPIASSCELVYFAAIACAGVNVVHWQAPESVRLGRSSQIPSVPVKKSVKSVALWTSLWHE